MGEYVAYTDGSCVNNRRNSKRARAGVGVWFGEDSPLNVSETLRTAPHTNQRAEIAACIRAIEQLEEATASFRLLIRTDSKYVIKAMTEWIRNWLKNGWRAYGGKPVQNRDLLECLWHKVQRHNVRFEHVKGHSGDFGNEMADWLASKGAGLERPKPGEVPQGALDIDAECAHLGNTWALDIDALDVDALDIDALDIDAIAPEVCAPTESANVEAVFLF